MRLVVLLTFLLLSFVSAFGQSSSQSVELTLKDIHGRTFRLSDYKGKVVLLNFWATWCPPCRTEIPDLIKMQTKYRNQGLRIIGVTYPPQRISEVRRFVRRLKVNYRIVIGTKASKTIFSSSEALPLTIAIDRDGYVREVIEGIIYSDEFDQKVKPLLSAP